ncbi:MAG: hybrid sensor histidine kinase/response regulator [Nitrospirae bacterium]|nr:hybrid sensor histidine kinase/response regulator [Nitrospirota bacterium]
MEQQNILIVDDKVENLLVLETVLQSPQVNLVRATSGKEALWKLLKDKFMLVILDVQMPEMNGFEVAELIRMNKKTRSIPIIFISAVSKDQKYIFKGYELGAVDYLIKPVEPEILKGKVRVFLELDEQRQLITKQAEELEASNKYLKGALDDLQSASKMFKDEVEKRRKQEQILTQQSKMASMGEMINVIAHQWRQPLNSLGLLVQEIQEAYEFGELTKEYIADLVGQSMQQVEFMSKTIDDFRNYFKPAKEQTLFDVKQAMVPVLSMISPQLKKNEIECRFTCHTHDKTFTGLDVQFCCDDMKIFSFKNEFEHVLLNLISNAKDAILEKKASKPVPCDYTGIIDIDFYKKDSKIIIQVRDNGVSIPAEIVDRVFELYFTTKDVSSGSGVGLYMSKIIIEDKMGGKIYAENAENSDDGAVFTIEIATAEISTDFDISNRDYKTT